MGGGGQTQVVGKSTVTGGAQIVTSPTMAHLDRGVWPPATASTIRVIDFSLDRYPVVRLDTGPVSPCSSDSHFDLLHLARREMMYV